jgi:RNA polymerase sigma factor (sigma-70 family)
MTDEEFTNVYYPKYESVIRAIARKIAFRNDALLDDLVAEGMIALWKLDPAKAKINVDAYIRQSIKYKLIDWMRRERPAKYDSLETLLEHGNQLSYDEVGELHLYKAHDYHRPFLEYDQSVSKLLEPLAEELDGEKERN